MPARFIRQRSYRLSGRIPLSWVKRFRKTNGGVDAFLHGSWSTRTAGRLGPLHGTRLGDAAENLLTLQASKNRCDRGPVAVRKMRMAASFVLAAQGQVRAQDDSALNGGGGLGLNEIFQAARDGGFQPDGFAGPG
jgi:hypothetical protein